MFFLTFEYTFILREGISQADVLTHPFDAAREREKLAKRVSICL